MCGRQGILDIREAFCIAYLLHQYRPYYDALIVAAGGSVIRSATGNEYETTLALKWFVYFVHRLVY